MLETPLHHCYLIAADTVDDCAKTLEQQLKALSKESDTEFFIDVDVVETLTIEMARDLRERGQQKAANQALCFIRGFDIATVEAQNALLKIIESPAEGVHFFLITPQPDQLLETIQSRVWRLDDICAGQPQAEVDELVASFTETDSLSGRLGIVKKIDTKNTLRIFSKRLAQTDLPRENANFGRALELVADWSRDSGASVKLLGQYLAVAACGSPKKK